MGRFFKKTSTTEYYLVTDELKCHNLCSKLAFVFKTNVDLLESPTTFSAVTLPRISGDQT